MRAPLLTEFENCGVEYLVVGGWAVSTHARPRYTKDLDLWKRTVPVNVIDLDDLIATKRAAGRPHDQDDVKLLEAAKGRRKP